MIERAKAMSMLLLALALSAPVAAQEAPLELWGGINYLEPGMNVHKTYPKHSTYLTEKCKALIDWTVDGSVEKRLTTLKLSDGFPGSGCGPLVRDGLRSKYGEPVASSVTQPTLPNRTKTETYTFEARGVRITFQMSDGGTYGGDNWHATYEPLANVATIAAKL